MTIEEVACDDLLEITVTDLRPVAWVVRSGLVSRSRLSTQQRARRYAATLLVMGLLVLSLVPGERVRLAGAQLMTPAGAKGVAPASLPDLGGDRPLLWSRAARQPGGAGADSPPVKRHNMTLR